MAKEKAQETLNEELGKQSKLQSIRKTVLICSTVIYLWESGLKENAQAWTGLIKAKTPVTASP